MRSRRLALPPRCGSMLSSRCSLKRYLLLVLLRYTYTCSTGPPHDGTRQQDQVGWSGERPPAESASTHLSASTRT